MISPFGRKCGHGRGPTGLHTSPHADLPSLLGVLGGTTRPHGAIRKAKRFCLPTCAVRRRSLHTLLVNPHSKAGDKPFGGLQSRKLRLRGWGRGSLQPWLRLNSNFYPACLETGSGRSSRADRAPNAGGPFHSWPGHGGEEPPLPRPGAKEEDSLPAPTSNCPTTCSPGRPSLVHVPGQGTPLPIRAQARAACKDDPDRRSNESPDLMSSLRGGREEKKDRHSETGFWFFFQAFCFLSFSKQYSAERTCHSRI